ncbi:hypothetical protein CCR75_004001 [Bremia lactucae]|uniref:VPS37 C-terminal domain-containing protein n=1 Tax=Bremia lactucae TaxID=4779 RepID=A0A976IJU2_BRELC|nr:hypothetical protein CCR75_004001 [Bremia lactucae]
MSFFGYRTSSSRPSQQETHLSEVERLRGRQLASLVRAGGRAKNQEQTLFEVLIADTLRGPFTLRLHLLTDFPVRVPRLKTSFPLQHRWLDVAGNVEGHPDLNMWTAHSDLGRIVTEIVKELRIVASNLAETKLSTSPARHNLQASAALLESRASHASSSRQAHGQHLKPPQRPETSNIRRTQIPVIPATFSELEELTLPQLDKLSADEHTLKSFVSKMTPLVDFTHLRDEVLHSNRVTANTTIGYEIELRELQKVVEARRLKLQAAQQALAVKQARQRRIVARHRPDALLEQLSAAAKNVDNESDEIAMQFAHGDLDVAQFLSAFLPKRNLYHTRTLKLARVLKHYTGQI